MATMRVSRRALLGGTVGIGGTLALAACGQLPAQQGMAEPSSEEKMEAKAPTMEDAGPVKAIIPADETSRLRFDQVFALFAEDHPDVTFDIIWGSPTREMPPLVAAGVLPHMSWWGVNPHGFANVLRDVGPLMAANGLNREDYTESLFQANTWQGKLLGIPLGVNTTAVFYNKDMFEAAGVNYPSDEMTWDDAISMAQDIVGHFNPSGEIKVWGFNTHTYLPTRLGFLYGGTITTDGEIATDREVAIETTRHLHDAWAKHQVSPTGDQLKELGDYWGQTVFAQGHVAMHPSGTFSLEPYRVENAELQMGLAEMPYTVVGDRKVRGAFNGQEEVCLMEGREHPGADTFAVWMAQARHQSWLGTAGYLIPALKSVQDTFKAPESDPRPDNQGAFARAAEYATPYWPHPKGRALALTVRDHVRPYYLNGEITVEEAVDNALKASQQILDDWRRLNA